MPRERKSGKIPQPVRRPLWWWILIIMLPLMMSEIMFYMAGRTLSMVIFPIAWIGFWIAVAYRAGWLSRRNQR